MFTQAEMILLVLSTVIVAVLAFVAGLWVGGRRLRIRISEDDPL